MADFFAIEVGARGYCSNSVHKCFRKLGYPPKTIRSLIKELGDKSMKASFCIWAARDNPTWKPEQVSWLSSLNKSAHQGTCPLTPKAPTHRTPAPTATIRPKVTNKIPIGLSNHGNTCYVNSLLQAIFSVPELWTRVPSTFL